MAAVLRKQHFHPIQEVWISQYKINDNNFDKEEVCDELADVLVYCVHMADCLGVNLKDIINNKMDKNEKKYPVEKCKGTSKKYTEL